MRRFKNQPVPEGHRLFEFTTDMAWIESTRPMKAFLALEKAGWELEAVKPARFNRDDWYIQLPSGYIVLSASKAFKSAREAAVELKKVTGIDLADGQYYHLDDPQEDNEYFYALAMLDEYGDVVATVEGEALAGLAVKPQTPCSKETMDYIEQREKKHFGSEKYRKKKVEFVPPKSRRVEFEEDDRPVRSCRG